MTGRRGHVSKPNRGRLILEVTDLFYRWCNRRRRGRQVIPMTRKSKKKLSGLKPCVVLLQSSQFNCRAVPPSGGFEAFQTCFPYLCETQDKSKCPAIAQLSQPCLPPAKVGPTRVLSHLYLGSQQDVLDEDLLQRNGIDYVLNISKSCPAPSYIPANHFLRIPVKDNYGETILSWLDDAIQFIDKVKSADGKVIVHCLAGISRSPTVAIAYIMKRMNMTNETAYKFVKAKRPTISPNFNFLGQLIEYEKLLRTPSHSKSCDGVESGPFGSDISTGCQVTCTVPNQSKEETDRRKGSDHQTRETDLKRERTAVGTPEPNVTDLSGRRYAQPRSRSPKPASMAAKSSPPTVTLSDLTAAAQSTSGQTTTKSHKRSMSEKENSKLSPNDSASVHRSTSLPSSPQQCRGTIPRPAGLTLRTVSSHLGPGAHYPESPERRRETKKPRSGNTTPIGVGALEWGTSNLTMNSPGVRAHNPFVEACEKFQAESRVRDGDHRSSSACSERREEDRVVMETQTTSVTKGSPTAPSKNNSIEYSSHQGNVQPITSQAKEKPRASPNKSILKTSKKLDLNPPQQGPAAPDQTHAKSPRSLKQQVSKLSPGILQKGVLRNLPQHLKLRIKVSPSKPDSPSHATPPHSTCDSLTRQTSGQSHCSESSVSSGISPNPESDASSPLERHSSISSGISPDYHSPATDASGSPSKAPPTYPSKAPPPACPTSSELKNGWNPFRFPHKQGGDSPADTAGESVWQKRIDSSDSLSSGGSPKRGLHQSSPTTAMDRGGATYYARCKFDPEERRDSWDSVVPWSHNRGGKCNSGKGNNMRVLGVRSQSCEEISSCAREAVVSEMVRSSRESLLQYGLTRFEDDEFDTCSLSSERSLSSSCEMIEVS